MARLPRFASRSKSKEDGWSHDAADEFHQNKRRQRRPERERMRDRVDGFADEAGDLGNGLLRGLGGAAGDLLKNGGKLGLLITLAVVAGNVLRERLTEIITGRSPEEILAEERNREAAAAGRPGGAAGEGYPGAGKPGESAESRQGAGSVLADAGRGSADRGAEGAEVPGSVAELPQGAGSRSMIVPAERLLEGEGEAGGIGDVARSAGFRLPYRDRLSGLERVDEARLVDDGERGKAVTVAHSVPGLDGGPPTDGHVTIASNGEVSILSAGRQSVDGERVIRRSYVGVGDSGDLSVAGDGAVGVSDRGSAMLDTASTAVGKSGVIEREILGVTGNVDLATVEDQDGRLSRNARFIGDDGQPGQVRLSSGRAEFSRLGDNGEVMETRVLSDPGIGVGRDGNDSVPEQVRNGIATFAGTGRFPEGVSATRGASIVDAAAEFVAGPVEIGRPERDRGRQPAAGVEF